VCCQSQPEDAPYDEGAGTITYAANPSVTNDELNALFAAAWPDYLSSDFGPILFH
jgi:hypothetical protein